MCSAQYHEEQGAAPASVLSAPQGTSRQPPPLTPNLVRLQQAWGPSPQESPTRKAARGCRDPTGILTGGLTRRPPSTPTLSLPGKKCTYGIKCKFYHPERPHQAQLAVADELRAQTRAWRGAGGEEERPGSARAASLAEQGGSRDAPAARPGPREPGTRSLPTARRSAGVATLQSSFSRLFLSDDPGLLRAPPRGPGCGLAPAPPGPDWVAPGSLSSLPAPPGLLSPPGLRGGYGARAPQSDRPSPRQQPGNPWVLPPGAGQLPGRSAWAESDWDDGAFGGPLRPAPLAVAGEVDARARARTSLYSMFPPREVDSIMALFPELSDVARLMLLIQRFQRSSAPVGKR